VLAASGDAGALKWKVTSSGASLSIEEILAKQSRAGRSRCQVILPTIFPNAVSI
jgi:hypothetical protein